MKGAEFSADVIQPLIHRGDAAGRFSGARFPATHLGLRLNLSLSQTGDVAVKQGQRLPVGSERLARGGGMIIAFTQPGSRGLTIRQRCQGGSGS